MAREGGLSPFYDAGCRGANSDTGDGVKAMDFNAQATGHADDRGPAVGDDQVPVTEP